MRRNPISTALYGRFGMFPSMTLLELSGPTRPATAQGRLRLEPDAPPATDLARLDRLVLDAPRPEDHAFWSTTPAVHGYSLRWGTAWRAMCTSRPMAPSGRSPSPIRPGCRPPWTSPVGEAASLGASTARVRIPGVARSTIADLLARGWRYGDGPTLVLTSAPWGHWEGYVTSGADALRERARRHHPRRPHRRRERRTGGRRGHRDRGRPARRRGWSAAGRDRGGRGRRPAGWSSPPDSSTSTPIPTSRCCPSRGCDERHRAGRDDPGRRAVRVLGGAVSAETVARDGRRGARVRASPAWPGTGDRSRDYLATP